MANYIIGNAEAEAAIIGNIINNPKLIIFTKDHGDNLFQNIKYRKIYRVIESMVSKISLKSSLGAISKYFFKIAVSQSRYLP